jgi:hypothetical protein
MSHRFVFREGTVTLNDEQARIVRQSPTQSLRILASAGSGKTTTLTARIAHLLTHCGAAPHEIVLLTFTHNAAVVMRERLEALVGDQRILCGTFHALSQQILRDQNPAALNDVYHVDELPLKALDFFGTAAGRTWTRKIRWIFIDEFQDINDTQYAFIRAIHHPAATVTIVGDDAQNIYTWRGSCVDYILNFHKRFVGVVDFQLATNYRSAAAIVAVANSIMRYIPTLDHKELMMAAPTAPAGTRPEVHYFARTAEERDWVCEAAVKALSTGSVVILSKFNSVLYSYEATLLHMGVRVRFVQGEESLGATATPTVWLSTFHGSKGLEWDHVYLVRMNDDVFPQQKDEESVLQERRLFYVAVTRARQTLTFTYSRNERNLSRFVREIHRPLLNWKGIPWYELSTLSSAVQLMTVKDWVNYLAGEDYRSIKQLNILPAALRDPAALLEAMTTPTTTFGATTDTPWVTPYWWVEKGMVAEFFDFLRTYWHREVACHRPESGGQWDRDAQRVIWTVKIAAEDAALFEAQRPLFESLAAHFFGATERGSPPPQINYPDVIRAIGKIAPAADFNQADLIRIIQIIHKMRTVLYNLRFAHIALDELRFAPIKHSPPQESRCQLIEAWRAYTDCRGPAPLSATYLVALCRAIGEGRSGVLAELPGEREWNRCRLFLEAFRERVATVISESVVLCRVVAEVVTGVTAEADMVVGDTAWFFVPGDQPSELQRLDRMVIVLLTVHALRVAGHTINHVCLFQLISGRSLTWPVTSWSQRSSDLLTAFIQARVQHTMAP